LLAPRGARGYPDHEQRTSMDEHQSGHVLAGRYRLDRQLGRGAMGAVWAAMDAKLRRPVAIKVLKDRGVTHETSLARFEQEAMVVARLRSPYIVQVYDYGIEGDCPFIVMELLEGEDLGKRLKDTTHPLPLMETTRIIVQTAKGLHAAHQAGLIHRDLKPANIFLVEEHGEALAKVFDFGIAKTLSGEGSDSEMTAEGILLGTPRYMSPEQAHGAKHVDHRTDLWSLGVIAYVCVTGRYPFRGSGLGEIIASVCTERPQPPSQLLPELSPAMDAFFEVALAKDPERRFQSARELGAAFAGLTDASIPSLEISRSGLGELPCPALDETGATKTSGSSFSALPAGLGGGAALAATGGATSGLAARAAIGSDGSLGAASHTLAQERARRRRLGLLLGASVVLGAVVGVVVLARTGGVAASEGGVTSTASGVTPGTAGSSAASASTTALPAATAPVAGASSSATPPESAGAEAPTSRPPKGSRGASASTKGGAEPPATTATATTPPKKSSGNGLDQFDGRF
jgi:serine/threonine-protein kinase